ncbi:Ubiquitin-conjugating enzyme E2Q-like protein 1 [Galemys pyrenaicus]|uniref:Ubiquitin-conjugating enzyme E2Q-like protein 1 n=1 Tax=Galemys pyrenaicus TaxID=202257 RepID=A0A8J6A591_GALPY|nr:Ubiquitin-conjugating enzyme E2Q-like protein 1 [Galemys pyrenaicus]
MATLLRKIGLIRLHNRDTEDPKHHHHHRGGGGQHSASLRGKGGAKSGGHKPPPPPPGGAGDASPGPGQRPGKRVAEPAPRDKPPAAAAGAVGAGGPRERAAGARAGPGPAGAAGAAGGSLVPAARQQHCTQVRSRRLMKELQDIARLSDRFISVELVDESLFDWNVKLHQVDKDSVLWQDMKETNTEFILLNLTFPDNFPFSPPFMRVLSPRLENGYVLDGGAICMELLTPRGWSSAYTVEAVMRQFAASLVKGQVRPHGGEGRREWGAREPDVSAASRERRLLSPTFPAPLSRTPALGAADLGGRPQAPPVQTHLSHVSLPRSPSLDPPPLLLPLPRPVLLPCVPRAIPRPLSFIPGAAPGSPFPSFLPSPICVIPPSPPPFPASPSRPQVPLLAFLHSLLALGAFPYLQSPASR